MKGDQEAHYDRERQNTELYEEKAKKPSSKWAREFQDFHLVNKLEDEILARSQVGVSIFERRREGGARRHNHCPLGLELCGCKL
jgi:hypothetical protein